jgi:predicted PurR-regulated permease PerM
LVIIFAVLVGGRFFGPLGMLLAIPIVGIGRVLLLHKVREIVAEML